MSKDFRCVCRNHVELDAGLYICLGNPNKLCIWAICFPSDFKSLYCRKWQRIFALRLTVSSPSLLFPPFRLLSILTLVRKKCFPCVLAYLELQRVVVRGKYGTAPSMASYSSSADTTRAMCDQIVCCYLDWYTTSLKINCFSLPGPAYSLSRLTCLGLLT